MDQFAVDGGSGDVLRDEVFGVVILKDSRLFLFFFVGSDESPMDLRDVKDAKGVNLRRAGRAGDDG